VEDACIAGCIVVKDSPFPATEPTFTTLVWFDSLVPDIYTRELTARPGSVPLNVTVPPLIEVIARELALPPVIPEKFPLMILGSSMIAYPPVAVAVPFTVTVTESVWLATVTTVSFRDADDVSFR
jgi:hypothetical protein